MKYSQEQLKAIRTNDKNLRIIACAGSGKTSTLAGKVEYLLNPDNNLDVKPENIIAFTYTEKAASELKNKILNKVGDLSGMANMYVGTIHGWCLKALQENEFKYQNFSVLDEIKLKLFVDKHYNNIGMKEITKLSNQKVSLRRFVDTSIFTRTMDIIRESELSDGEDIPNNILKAREKYEQILTSQKFFDFSMILDKALYALKEDGNLTNKIKSELKYLIVDEYQDVNPIQEELINTLWKISNCKLVVVGDDDQNIYQWRGSNNRYIINFGDKISNKDNFEDIRLDVNYRSSVGITKLAEKFISFNKERIADKKMISHQSQEFVKNEDILYNIYDNVDDENEDIAKYINDIIGVKFSDSEEENRGIAYSDICILLRKWSKAKAISDILEKHNIPFITAGVNQLFDTTEVQASLSIFSYIRGDISKEELIDKWLEIPDNKLSKEKLSLAINGNDTNIKGLDYYFPENDHIKDNWEYSLQDIFWNFMETAEIFEENFIDLKSMESRNFTKDKAEIIFFNLGKFSQVINDFEEINFNRNKPSFHLFSFLNFITYAARDYYPEGWLNSPYKTPNAVQIMTIHQSKGLEFPVVIIPGLNRNYLPSKKKGGLSEWHFIDRSLIKEQNRYEGDKEKEDERRLLYVALTRSQKYLLLSRAPDLNNRLYIKESPFIQEILQANVVVDGQNHSFSQDSKTTPKPKEKVKNIILDFTTLKDFFECPYRFKLVSLYGFCFPLNQRMGVGRSFHNCLMELHKRLQKGDSIDSDELDTIIENQTFFPHLTKSTKLSDPLKEKVKNNVHEYYRTNKDELKNIEFVEQEIQYKIDDNILILGRVDLIKKQQEFGKYETTIVEFKSDDDKNISAITDDQLKMYALGHKELTGEIADYIMTYYIGNQTRRAPYPLENKDLEEIENRIKKAAETIRNDQFVQVEESKKAKCKTCYQNRLCVKRLNYQVKSIR
jgi:DNA helicase-2/ATP-dependent DNA helicase PcrA